MTEPKQAALRALERLHRITSEPPASDAEPEEVLNRGGEVLAAREEALRDLAAALDRDPAALRELAEARLIYAAIQERVAQWQAALARARHIVGERVQAVARLRLQARR
ncbi:MAG TPA: hypothetical protein VNO33_05385 [Kofleriaceae bacterium]|nr:hypothetical protein [Kofleriaceae bacterium]